MRDRDQYFRIDSPNRNSRQKSQHVIHEHARALDDELTVRRHAIVPHSSHGDDGRRLPSTPASRHRRHRRHCQPDDERWSITHPLRNAASDFLASAFSGDSDISFSMLAKAEPPDSISTRRRHPRPPTRPAAATHTLASAFARFADAASPRWRYAAARFGWYTATFILRRDRDRLPNAPIASSHRFCAYNSPPRSFALLAAAALTLGHRAPSRRG